MNVFIIGSGGREHALVRALSGSNSVKNLYIWPGNEGIPQEIRIHVNPQLNSRFNPQPNPQLNASSLDPSLQLLMDEMKKRDTDLVIIGPEAPLVEGWANHIRSEGIYVFGPSQAAAQLEGSKIYAKEFMIRHGIPTAHGEEVRSVSDVQKALVRFTPPYVLKADGLAAGKGVTICQTKKDLLEISQKYFEEQAFGKASSRALLEAFQEGWELSFFILTNGEDYKPLPLAQDYKKLKDGHKGPNTGGMGAVAPLGIEAPLMKQLHEKILQPSVEGIKKSQLDYKGLLYVGIMVTPEEGPKVIEYNVRFGDPEAQVILPLFKGDWGEAFREVACGQLPSMDWHSLHSACVVLAAENYPTHPLKGSTIEGDVFFESPSSYFLHGGTQRNKEGKWLTHGGRVLNAVAIGSTREQALKRAYHQASQVTWKGLQKRMDIGQGFGDIGQDFWESDPIMHLNQGKVLAYPTESVWGLGVLAHNPQSLQRLRAIKGRQEDQPMSIFVPNPCAAAPLVDITKEVQKLLEIFWPGPITFVLPAKDKGLAKKLGHSQFIGLRCSDHPGVQHLVRQCPSPLVTTSANPSGKSPATKVSDLHWLPHDVMIYSNNDSSDNSGNCDNNDRGRGNAGSVGNSRSSEPSLVVKIEKRIYFILRPHSSHQKNFEMAAQSLGLKQDTPK